MGIKTFLIIICAVYIIAAYVWSEYQSYKKDLRIEQLEREKVASKKFVFRLCEALNKEKGIDKPFIMPLDPAPDFDIDAIFKAIEESATEETDDIEGGAET